MPSAAELGAPPGGPGKPVCPPALRRGASLVPCFDHWPEEGVTVGQPQAETVRSPGCPCSSSHTSAVVRCTRWATQERVRPRGEARPQRRCPLRPAVLRSLPNASAASTSRLGSRPLGFGPAHVMANNDTGTLRTCRVSRDAHLGGCNVCAHDRVRPRGERPGGRASF